MIVYQTTKKGFLDDVAGGCIEDIIRESVKKKLNQNVGNNEYISWKNSLGSMYHVVNNELIPNDAGIAIEYSIPRTKNRVDFIITGQDENNADKVIIIELKQWSEIEITDKDAIVSTRFQHGPSLELHPSYQAWSYSALLNGFNATVYNEKIGLEPCAYLHNFIDSDVIKNSFYNDYLSKAPVFCKGEKDKLQNFITRFIKHGDKSNIMYRIDNGEIRPSKNLADSMTSMIKGDQEFVMIDDQKIVYETALSIAKKSSRENKNVLIVEGGPGTGKSVVAINLIVAITKLGLNTQYVTKNAAPRAVFESKLTGTLKRTEISNMFTGSGSYIGCEPNTFDCLVVDEAHRLNEKSGMFKNLGENQIKEIIEASKSSVFFIDEDQKVTWHDIGKKEEIERWASELGVNVQNLKLESQFRCNGSDGYLAWVDDVLQIKDTANYNLDGVNYDFKVFDDPNTLKREIFKKNEINNKARIVAGYCWNWVSKKESKALDIVIPEHNFDMKWNLASDGNTWIISEKSVNEVGCIHTCQGLEVDYVGVIIGDDFVIRNGWAVTNPDKRAKTDASLKGYKKELKINKSKAIKKADAIIKNTYRTLMTRGMKGCYIYCTDKETSEYFKNAVGKKVKEGSQSSQVKKTPYLTNYEMISLPLYDSVGCGDLVYADPVPQDTILVRKDYISPGSKYFVLQAYGDSMNKAGINDGDLVLCRKNYHPEEGNKIVALIGDNATIKEYKRDGNSVLLVPHSNNPKHVTKRYTPDDDIKTLGVVLRVLEN